MDPDTLRSLRSRIRMDLLPYCEGRSMIPVDLSANSANCEGRIYDPNGTEILGIRSRDLFSGSTDVSAVLVSYQCVPVSGQSVPVPRQSVLVSSQSARCLASPSRYLVPRRGTGRCRRRGEAGPLGSSLRRRRPRPVGGVAPPPRPQPFYLSFLFRFYRRGITELYN